MSWAVKQAEALLDFENNLGYVLDSLFVCIGHVLQVHEDVWENRHHVRIKV